MGEHRQPPAAVGVEPANHSTFARIYAVVRRIPAGQAATYGQIARLIGQPKGARVVGYAMAACPRNSAVPCHRVVNRFGKTSAAFDTFAPGTQRALLEAEGVAFTLAGTVDLAQCRWTPESHCG